MEGLFRVSGRFRDAGGRPITGLVVILYDEDDFDADDLLGVGEVDEDGGFRMSFARSEFAQDTLEYEVTPDLMVAAIQLGDKQLRPVFARSFHELKWEGLREDLGDLVLENYDPAHPVFIEGVKLPLDQRHVTRLELTDELVQECFAEIIPLVEKHTGWTGVAKDLPIKILDGLGSIVLRDLFLEKGTDEDSLEGLILQTLAEQGGGFSAVGGLYDPPTDTIYLSRACMQQNGIEFLKVVLAHELVHAGQFRNTPGLADYLRDYQLRTSGRKPTTDGEASLAERRQFMIELEGYATYIERDFIRKLYYRLAVSDVHASLIESAGLFLAWLASLGLGYSLPPAPPSASMEDKFKQYEEGVALYRSRAQGDQPARWEITVASLPGGAAFAPA